MQRITLRQARPGMTLARGVLDPGDGQQVLLEHGVRLTTRAMVCLHEAGVFDLWVNWPGLEQFEGFTQATFSDSQRRLGECLRQGFINQSEILADSPLAFSRLDESASLLAHPVFEAATQCLSLEECMASTGETILRHGAEVAVLTLALARRLETYIAQERRWVSTRPMRDLTSLALGCLFHDIGELRASGGPRTAQEEVMGAEAPAVADDSWQKHPMLGYDMIRRQIDPVAASMVLHHHRHFDGTGFGAGDEAPGEDGGRDARVTGGAGDGRRLHIFWRLLAATDTLDHLRKLDGVPMPMVYALSQIQKAPYAQWLDPVVLEALLEVVPAFVPGMLVRLSDGNSGVVEYCGAAMPCCPVVRLLAAELGDTSRHVPECELVDLRYNGSCWVKEIDGTDVADHLYGPMPERHTPEPEIPRELALVA